MSGLPDYEHALALALADLTPPSVSETVDLTSAAGRVLGQPVVADRDLPPFHRAQMDGYALRASEVGHIKSFAVQGRISAGAPADIAVPPGTCVAIATGAALPRDVDTVIQHELSDRGNPVHFTVERIERGHAVHQRGADARSGEELIRSGTLLRSHHIGVAAAVGCTGLSVATRPRAIVISSGDEVQPVGASVQPHQIRNSNGPMVTELLRRFGADCIDQRMIPDDPDETMRTVGEALSECDLLVTIGGISAGERDYLPDAFDSHGVVRKLCGAMIQPGRPIVVGRSGDPPCVVVGLPGNPVSSLACACLFVWPIVQRLLGLETGLPWRQVRLDEAVNPNPRRRAFRPAMLTSGGGVAVPPWAGSGDLAHTSRTDGLLELPIQESSVEPGAILRFLPWP